MKVHAMFLWAASLCLASTVAGAQSRDPGWEFGGDIVYQTSNDFDIINGSTEFDDDIGVSLFAGYRMSSRVEFQFGLDWSTIDYNAEFVPIDFPLLGTVSVDSEIEAITPFAKVNFNFIDGPITPFVSANLGWSFIDTNIPDGPPQTGCWWDPWYGQVCSTFQSTRNTDSFTYGLGLGVRWDLTTGYSLRFAYEKQWYDVDQADSAPDFDRFKLGIIFVY